MRPNVIIIFVLILLRAILKNPLKNLFEPKAHFLEISKPSFSSTFLKCDAFVMRLLRSLRTLTMSRPSRDLFLYILYCKHVHMCSPAVICTALAYLYTITYHIHNTIQNYLVLLYFLSNKRRYKESNPWPQQQLHNFIKLLSKRVYHFYSYLIRVDS